MELVLRGLVVYLALFVLMRVAGNRQFAEMTAFDVALVIVIAEVTGQALMGEDYSVTGAVVVIATIIGADILLSVVKHRFRALEPVLEGMPTLLVDEGRLLEEAMRKERVTREDLLSAARQAQGLESLDAVKYAVLEPSGAIAIVPWGAGER